MVTRTNKRRCDTQGIAMVSTERIYQYIYSNQSQGGLLYKHLRTARRWRRKRLNRKHQRGQIPNRIMIDERPEIVNTKQRFGDLVQERRRFPTRRTLCQQFNLEVDQ